MTIAAPQTKTTPISGFSRSQLTAELIERARKIASDRGDKQFGFRLTKTSPFHTIIVTRGGTLENPTGAMGDSCEDA